MTADARTGFIRQRQCRHGSMLYNPNDVFIGQSLELYGEYSEGEVELFRQLVPEGGVVLDVGAHIGTHTVFFARCVGPSGKVLAFEPQRMQFYTLCGNVALNSLTNVWCYPDAVGAAPGTLLVPGADHTRPANFGALGLGSYRTGEPAQVVTIDSFDVPRCNLIKADVEGMELAVLQGAATTIGRCRPYLYLENDRPEHAAELIRYVDQLGYALYWHRPRLFNPNNYAGNTVNVFGDIASMNVLGIHRSIQAQLEGFTPISP